MRTYKQSIYRVLAAVAAVSFVAGFASPVLAAPTDASLTLGDSRPSQTTTYTFDVSTLDAGTSIQCVELDLGASSDGSGAVTGLDTSSSALDSGTAFGTFGNWSVDNTGSANHQLRATYATGETLNASGNIVWSGVDNGSTADTGYFGVFTTYTDSSCSSANETITVQFIYTDGTDVSLTVDPAFTFSVNAVNSGVDTEQGDATSTDTTVTTTATTVPFSNSVTTSANGVAAQDLTISTNAQSGYNIYLRQTQALTNGSSDTIDAVSTDTSCTYASPAAFSSAGTEAFGFRTDDSDISSGNYTTNNAWCDVTGTNQAVSTSTAPTSGTETTRIGYQVGISASTEAGTYSNTIIYTAVPTY